MLDNKNFSMMFCPKINICCNKKKSDFTPNFNQPFSVIKQDLKSKILHTGNSRPSYMCVSIPWVLVYTISPCQYHESLSIPFVLVNTMRPCQYHESMPIPWVLKRYLKVQVVPKVQEVPKGPRGTSWSKRYLKVQDVPKGSRGTLMFTMYQKV